MTTRNAASMGLHGSDWQHKGYCGRGPVGSLLDSLQGRPALVVGSAEGVFDELLCAMNKMDDPIIFASNDVGMYLPKLDHWVSLHTQNLAAWKDVRWLHPKPHEVTKYHGIEARPYIDHVWEALTPLFCLSGYFAMQIAWLMGCAPIVLCGCPGDATRRFFDLPDTKRHCDYGSGKRGNDTAIREQITQEMKRLPEFKAVVRSMSGWTREFFGER